MAIQYQHSRPTITRSDALVSALRSQGLNEGTLADDIAAMRVATRPMVLTFRQSNGSGRKMTKEIQVPDWKTRLAAATLQTEIEGWKYQPQKAQDQHPLIVILNQLPDDIRSSVENAMQNRLQSLLRPGEN